MTCNETTLFQEIHPNKLHITDSRMLVVPQGLRVSRKQLQEMREKEVAEPCLSFYQLQFRLHDLLTTEPLSLKAAATLPETSCWGEKKSDGRSACHHPQRLRKKVLDLISRVDDETRRFLKPVMESWMQDDTISMCTRVMDVLRCKRRALQQGMGAPLQDLVDWVRLAILFGEDMRIEEVLEFASQLEVTAQREVQKIAKEVFGRYFTNTMQELLAGLQDLASTSEADLRSTSSICGHAYTTTLDYLIELDAREMRPNPSRVTQPEIRHGMRAVLCEWMFDFAINLQRYPMKMETYFLAVALLDRLLAVRVVKKQDFFLYGCAALLLASKYEEVYAISLRCLTSGPQRTFTTAQLLDAELSLAAALKFSVATATSSQLSAAILVAQRPPASSRQRFALDYVAATLALHAPLGRHPQAHLAAAAAYVSRLACGVATGGPSAEVRALLPFVQAALLNNTPDAKVGAILWRTFADERFGAVAPLFTEWPLPGGREGAPRQ